MGRAVGLVVVSAAFVAAGLALLALGRDPGRAAFAVAFFGACLAVGVWMLRAELALRRSLAVRGDFLLEGGVPITSSGWQAGAASLGFLALGMTFPLFAPGWIPLAVGLASVGLGGFGLFGALTGRGRTEVVALPDGLWIGSAKVRYRLPWDGLEVGLGDLHGNPAVLLRPADPEGVLASAHPSARDALRRGFATSEAFVGAPVALMAGPLGVEAGGFARALARYASDPAARGELAPRARLPGGSA